MPSSTRNLFLKKMMRCLIGIVIGFGGLSKESCGEVDPVEQLQAQARIEDEITKVLRGQLAPEEFFLVIDLDLEEIPDGSQEKKSSSISPSSLPYLTLRVDPEKLRASSGGVGPLTNRFKIKGIRAEVTFDQRIPEEKRKILEAFVRRKLAIDGVQRTLQVSSAPLVSESIADQLRSNREQARRNIENAVKTSDSQPRSESERLKFDLEVERVKLEVAKKDLEIQRNRLDQTREISDIEGKMRQLELKLNNAEKAVTAEKEKNSRPKNDPIDGKTVSPQDKVTQEPGLLGSIAKIQGVVVGALITFVLLVGLFIGSGAFKRGMSSLAEGFAKIGTGVKDAAVATVEAEKERVRARSKESVSGDEEKNELNRDGEGPKVPPSAIGPNALNEGDRQRFDEFLNSVQDKIEILAKERSFALYREIQDFVDSDQSLPMAAALLLSLTREATIELVKGLNTSHIERLKRYLGRSGAMQESKALRNAALQEFYGRIVVEEFSGSSIMQMKDADWLLRLSNSELAKITMDLPDDLRPAFLVCFSPLRVKKMVEAAGSESAKKAIVGAAVNLESPSQEDVHKLLGELMRIRNTLEPSKDGAGLVDRARYLSRLAESLGNEDQKLLLSEINRKEDVQRDFSKYYVPFNVIQSLPKEVLLEIFGDRPDAQVALMIFAAEESVRQAVLKALPEVRAATVADELQILDSKPFYKIRNERQSFALQRQVSSFLLRLKEEGLLDRVAPGIRVVHGAA